MNSRTRAVAALSAVAGFAMLAFDDAPARAHRATKQTEAVVAFTHTLSPAEEKLAKHALNDAERTNWIFVRGERPGLFLKDMDEDTRKAAAVLIDSFLSSLGREQWRLIRAIEAQNGANEKAGGATTATWGDDLYSVQIFADDLTSAQPTWAAQIEGHHFVLNAACVDGVVTVTPAFTGAYPVAVAQGASNPADVGKRPLGAAVEVAFALVKSFDDAQRTTARVLNGTPADVLFAVGSDAKQPDMRGVTRASMTAAQQKLIDALLAQHAGLLDEEVASAQLREWREKHAQELTFAFVGEADLAKAHYYRLTSPCFTIEYDCTNGDANHVHCVWSDPHANFGGDALRAHLKSQHGK